VTAGYLGGAADEGLSLLSNVFLVLPALPLLIIVLAESGRPLDWFPSDRSSRARWPGGRASFARRR